MTHASVVVVGAGLTGTRTALALRRHAPDARVVLLGDEARPAYERPPLSKEYLAHAREADALTLAGAQVAQLRERGIEVHLARRASRIDSGRVVLEDGRHLEADALVLATGARPRTLPATCDPARVHVLRSLDDARRLRDVLRSGQRLVVIGSGFLGAEVASTAHAQGVAVTMLEAATTPFERTLGRAVGGWLARRWRSVGIDLRVGAAVAGIVAGNGDAEAVVLLADGSRIAADHVLVAIGTVPNDELFHDAFAGIGSRMAGIPVDHAGRTPIPGIWAAGDVALVTAAGDPLARRTEHWTDAALAADRVARDIAGLDATERAAPYAWSDQFGVRVQVAGLAGAPLDARVEDAGDDTLLVHYLDAAGELRGVLGIGHPGYVARCRRDLVA
jgi:NADPH-dependent 2,4-dienoyl-CoA reductase/sulfur reductase-like enzyme